MIARYAKAGETGLSSFNTLLEKNQVPVNLNTSIVGISEPIKRIKKQMDFASRVNFPVFITGESGTEKKTIAYQIHQDCSFNNGKFVHIPAYVNDIVRYKAYLNHGFERAKNGTLYLSEVDNLSSEQMDYLTSLFALQDFHQILKEENIRLIVSYTEPLLLINNSRKFLAKFLDCSTSHLELHLPPLRQRREDLIYHIQDILKSLSPNEEIHITRKAMSLLTNYSWPGNTAQLHRVMMVLVSCRNNSEINDEDILALNIITEDKRAFDVADVVCHKKFESIQHIHPSLLKALMFMSDNYTEELTLTELASSAYTSPSHLSFLFREHLNHSFKTILVQVRIRCAKEQIETYPMKKITDICLFSGFGDLSHFEKMFKRYVGCTPRQYRQRRREQASLSYTD